MSGNQAAREQARLLLHRFGYFQPEMTDAFGTMLSQSRTVCGEAYQAVGVLAHMGKCFDDPAVQALLDNLADAADGRPLSHESILPFYPEGWNNR